MIDKFLQFVTLHDIFEQSTRYQQYDGYMPCVYICTPNVVSDITLDLLDSTEYTVCRTQLCVAQKSQFVCVVGVAQQQLCTSRARI